MPQREENVGGPLCFIMPMLRGCSFDFGAAQFGDNPKQRKNCAKTRQAMGSYEEKR